MVPFVDLKVQYQSIKQEIDAAIACVVESASFILGPEVEEFEYAFAEYVGARFCVGVNSGTAALQLALLANGVGVSDEVIVPVNSFFATAEVVSTAGTTPVFVDADPVSYTIDISKIEEEITPRTRAIIQFIFMVRQQIWMRFSRSLNSAGWSSSKTLRKHTALNTKAAAFFPKAMSAASVFIRGRILAPTAKLERWSPTTKKSFAVCDCCVIMAPPASTITKLCDITFAWKRFKLPCSALSCVISTPGSANALTVTENF
jgi:hypothetical protein